jgi:hypothetical protein
MTGGETGSNFDATATTLRFGDKRPPEESRSPATPAHALYDTAIMEDREYSSTRSNSR